MIGKQRIVATMLSIGFISFSSGSANAGVYNWVQWVFGMEQKSGDFGQIIKHLDDIKLRDSAKNAERERLRKLEEANLEEALRVSAKEERLRKLEQERLDEVLRISAEEERLRKLEKQEKEDYEFALKLSQEEQNPTAYTFSNETELDDENLDLFNEMIPPVYGCNDAQFPFAEEKPEKKYILSFAGSGDHNGALANDLTLRDQFDQLEDYEVDFQFDVDSVDQIMDRIKKLKRENETLKISHLILHGHANSSAIYFGENPMLGYRLTKNSDAVLEYKKSVEFFQFILPLLEDGASILIHGCSAGEGSNSFGSWVAEQLPGHVVYASDSPISQGELLLGKNFYYAQDAYTGVKTLYQFKKDIRVPFAPVEKIATSVENLYRNL